MSCSWHCQYYSIIRRLPSLPLDPVAENYVRRNVPGAVFSVCRPTPLEEERKVVEVSQEVLRDILDMDPEEMPKDKEFADFACGNKVLEGSVPMAHRYGGHQFGVWVSSVVLVCFKGNSVK